jgi:hypothetical protein
MVALAMWLVSAAVVSFAGIVALYGVAAVVIGALLVAALPVAYLQYVLDECRHGHRERVRTRGRYFAPLPRTAASARSLAPPPYRAPSCRLR